MLGRIQYNDNFGVQFCKKLANASLYTIPESLKHVATANLTVRLH